MGGAITTPKICILDYGSGNVKSVLNAFKRLEVDAVISNEKNVIQNSSHLILPGVGSFGAAITKIRASIPMELVVSELKSGKMFLGICVGMQVLAEKGYEDGAHSGLELISGNVNKLKVDLPLPHVGWNNLSIRRSHEIFSGLPDQPDFYFVHSYAVNVLNDLEILADTEYGVDFHSAVCKENVIGVQFHPEKSQQNGLRLLRNFVGMR